MSLPLLLTRLLAFFEQCSTMSVRLAGALALVMVLATLISSVLFEHVTIESDSLHSEICLSFVSLVLLSNDSLWTEDAHCLQWFNLS